MIYQDYITYNIRFIYLDASLIWTERLETQVSRNPGIQKLEYPDQAEMPIQCTYKNVTELTSSCFLSLVFVVGAGFLFKEESAKMSSSSGVVLDCLTATNVKLIEKLKENNEKLELFILQCSFF